MYSTWHNHLEFLQFELLSQYSGVRHFVTTRHGGISQGNYASLNLGALSGDNPIHVAHNRTLVCDALGIKTENLIIPHQTHGTHILTIERSFLESSPKQQKLLLQGCDGIITSLQGVAIGVTTADCVPILLYCPQNKVVAALHAGWRGTVNNIVQQGINVMCKQFNSQANTIIAAIGPAISQTKFEVGDDVVAEFETAGMISSDFLNYNPTLKKAYIDLPQCNRHLLTEAGILSQNIEVAHLCANTHHQKFFSARHEGFASGRFVSGILLTT